MFEKIIAYLKGKGWSYTENKERGLINFSLSGDNGIFQCIAQVEEERRRLGFYSYCIATCPSDAILKMAELLMRLNTTVFFGNFELNFETGVIVYKTSLYGEDIELTPAVLDNVIISNVYVMDNYTPILLRLIYSNLSPVEAFQLRSGAQPQLES
ncbi:MAG TPA: YbjN domain-containing protein [Puia sp.]|nr:YbjN domain-containing protein [Puia sp.]